jgi:hypothetical protein
MSEPNVAAAWAALARCQAELLLLLLDSPRPFQSRKGRA